VEDAAAFYCQPVQYQAFRGWFGSPQSAALVNSSSEKHLNVGVDTGHRLPDHQQVPVCGVDHELVKGCSAIIALHPDEATDAIVDLAVQRQIPFVIVPCCVFFRLFPNRRNRITNKPVSTYTELVEYLMAKHQSIQRATLPFEGANIALWSTFS